MDQAQVQKLKDIARDVRVLALSSMGHLGVGHVGGAMSVVDILTYLYYDQMHIDPKNPRDEQRDRLVLSKGHAGPALYAVLARKGFFPHRVARHAERGWNSPSQPLRQEPDPRYRHDHRLPRPGTFCCRRDRTRHENGRPNAPDLRHHR